MQVLLHLLGADKDGRSRAHGDHRPDKTRAAGAAYRPAPPLSTRQAVTAPRPGPATARPAAHPAPLTGTAAPPQAPPPTTAARPPQAAPGGEAAAKRLCRGDLLRVPRSLRQHRESRNPRRGDSHMPPSGTREAVAPRACAQPPRQPARCRSPLRG